VIVQKGSKTTGGLAISRQPLVISHKHGGTGNGSVVPETKLSPQADKRQRSNHQQLQTSDDEQIDLTEE